MLSKAEAAALLSIVNSHHGNAPWTDIQLESFYSELLPSMTVGEAREAVRRFYASTPGGWCGSGHINAIVKRMRGESKPSEAQVEREAERLGLTGWDAWRYRRERMLGATPDRAGAIAASESPLRIGAGSVPVSRPRGESPVGSLPLVDVVGGA